MKVTAQQSNPAFGANESVMLHFNLLINHVDHKNAQMTCDKYRDKVFIASSKDFH